MARAFYDSSKILQTEKGSFKDGPNDICIDGTLVKTRKIRKKTFTFLVNYLHISSRAGGSSKIWGGE